MLSSSTWIDSRALKNAQKKYRYRNPYFDRRYRGLVKIAVVIGLLGAGILYKNRRAVEKRLHPLLLSRDDDAQYGNEYDFSHELAGRHASLGVQLVHTEGKMTPEVNYFCRIT